MNGQALDLRKERKRKKKLSPAFVRKLSWGAQKETGPGYLGTTRTLGSLGNARKDQLGLGYLKGAYFWTQGTKIGMSHQPPMVYKKGL